MDFYQELVVTTLIAVVGFIAWRVWTIESNHLKHIDSDLSEIKADLKWLIKYHDKEND